MNIILGIIIIIAGITMVIKTEWFLSFFGRIAFFEKHLGIEGGSRLGYNLIGLVIIFIGILVMTNMIGGFLNWVLSPLLKYSM